MTTLTAFYDLAIGPVSYDFVQFMANAKAAAQRINATRMHTVVVPFERGIAGMFRDKTKLYDEHEMHWRLWNLVLPACQLFGSSFTLATDWQQAKRTCSDKAWKCWPPEWDRQTFKDRHHLIGALVKHAKEGRPVPRIQASEHARRKVRQLYRLFGDKPVVTMTMRSTYMPERNSDVGAWLRARQAIEQLGAAVVVLQDTDVALNQGAGYGELNLDLRAACYQEAALNLVGNNGPATLCWFSDTPYRMFGANVLPEEWNELLVKQGVPLGESLPWAGPQQRFVYGKETTERIVEEYRAWASATS